MASPRDRVSLKMLRLILLSFLHFPFSLGFRFDNFTGTVPMWMPITLSWNRDASDTAQITFKITCITASQIQSTVGPFVSTTDTTQPDGTLNATFTRQGPCVITANAPNSSTIATSQIFVVAPASISGSSSSLYVTAGQYRAISGFLSSLRMG
ncbi:hypothetical protein EDD18DRAFT_449093 [Armillaria luteobubalina]|uniref:Uncharacterized protein n=1 Tax=Armillaria luteobubalina TaxID=153913 RepID=A0AA39PXW4_9AGAR|nr:hypothetical protein EDD18DRAFT_449093 [Armillaria luteobubalina]